MAANIDILLPTKQELMAQYDQPYIVSLFVPGQI